MTLAALITIIMMAPGLGLQKERNESIQLHYTADGLGPGLAKRVGLNRVYLLTE
jgi:hypothetical protein